MEVYDSFTVLYSLTRKAGAWNSYAAGGDMHHWAGTKTYLESVFRLHLNISYAHLHIIVNLLYTGLVIQQHLMLLEIPMTGEREKGRKGEREKGRKGEREKGRKGEREKGRKGEREKGRKGEREKGRKGERVKE